MSDTRYCEKHGAETANGFPCAWCHDEMTKRGQAAPRVLAQGHLHKLVKLDGGLAFMRAGNPDPLFTASYGSRACDLSPEATREDLASLVVFLAGRILALEEGRAP